jgi:hypothetical protein
MESGPMGRGRFFFRHLLILAAEEEVPAAVGESRRVASCTHAINVMRSERRAWAYGSGVYAAYTLSSRHCASPRSVEAWGASLAFVIIFGSGWEKTTSCRESFENPVSAARNSREAMYAAATSEPAASRKQADWLSWWATSALSGWRSASGSNEVESNEVFRIALKVITVLFSDGACFPRKNKRARARETSVGVRTEARVNP